MDTLRLYLQRIRSFTTDMGSELGLADVVDILPTISAWLEGACFDRMMGAVVQQSKLFPNALKSSRLVAPVR